MKFKKNYHILLAVNLGAMTYTWLITIGLMVLLSKNFDALLGASTVLILRSLPPFILTIVTGSMLDRFCKRKTVIASLILLSIITSLMYFGHNNHYVLLGLIVMGAVVETFLFPTLQSLVPIVCNQNSLLKYNSIMVGIDMAAMIIGPLMAMAIIKYRGTNHLLITAVVTLIAATTAAFFLKLGERKIKTGETIKNDFNNIIKWCNESFDVLSKSDALKKWSLLGASLYFGTGLLGSVELPFLMQKISMKEDDYGAIVAIAG